MVLREQSPDSLVDFMRAFGVAMCEVAANKVKAPATRKQLERRCLGLGVFDQSISAGEVASQHGQGIPEKKYGCAKPVLAYKDPCGGQSANGSLSGRDLGYAPNGESPSDGFITNRRPALGASHPADIPRVSTPSRPSRATIQTALASRASQGSSSARMYSEYRHGE